MKQDERDELHNDWKEATLKQHSDEVRHPYQCGGIIREAMDSGQRTQFETGAERDRPPGKGRFVLLSPLALRRIAIRCEEGERKYGDGRNWEKGMPVSEFIDSAMRHLIQYMSGDGSEDHLASAAWNLQAAMHIEEKMPEFQDIPNRKQVYDWFAQYAAQGGYGHE